jgi:hypothetical protein
MLRQDADEDQADDEDSAKLKDPRLRRLLGR